MNPDSYECPYCKNWIKINGKVVNVELELGKTSENSKLKGFKTIKDSCICVHKESLHDKNGKCQIIGCSC